MDGLRVWDDGVESQHFPLWTPEQKDAYAAEVHEDFWGKAAQQQQQGQQQGAHDEQANTAGNDGSAGDGNGNAVRNGGDRGTNAAYRAAPAVDVDAAADGAATRV
jgi:hypothetical protein